MLGWLIFLAIFLHKIPEGFTVSSVMLASGRSRGTAWGASVVLGGSTLAGVLTMAVFRHHVGAGLPLAAGVTIYVAASDLIPEVNKEPSMKMALLVFVGAACLAARLFRCAYFSCMLSASRIREKENAPELRGADDPYSASNTLIHGVFGGVSVARNDFDLHVLALLIFHFQRTAIRRDDLHLQLAVSSVELGVGWIDKKACTDCGCRSRYREILAILASKRGK